MTQELVKTFDALTTEATLAAGAVALYAFESQVPSVAREKVRGLREFYGMAGDDQMSFFTVHEALDMKHADAERAMIGALAASDADVSSAFHATDEATAALWRFLDGVY